MKLRLFDDDIRKFNEKVNLIQLPSFQLRLEHINNRVFNDEFYREYYNDKVRDRWLGKKVVGQKHPIEHVKHTLDIISGYLVGAKDYSSRKYIRRFLELHKKYIKELLNIDECNEYEQLKSNVLYHNKNDVFYVNVEYEKFLKGIKDELRLQKIKEIKQNMINIKSEMFIQIENKKRLKKYISELYRMNGNTEDILYAVEKIKEIDNDIRYLEQSARDTIDDYLIITEFQYKTK